MSQNGSDLSKTLNKNLWHLFASHEDNSRGRASPRWIQRLHHVREDLSFYHLSLCLSISASSLSHLSHRWQPRFQVSHEDTTASGQKPGARFLIPPFIKEEILSQTTRNRLILKSYWSKLGHMVTS